MNHLRATLTELQPTIRYYWMAGNREQEATVRRLERSLKTGDDADIEVIALHLRRMANYYWRPDYANSEQAAALAKLNIAISSPAGK
jgi:hypothetical protein